MYAAFWNVPALEALAAHHTKEDIAKLEQLLAETYKAKVDGIHALSQAMFLFHRTIIFLSGNTITPLILNAFLVAGLSFWEDYILTVGEDASLERIRNLFRLYFETERARSWLICKENG